MRLDALIAIQRLHIYFKILYMSEKSTRKKWAIFVLSYLF